MSEPTHGEHDGSNGPRRWVFWGFLAVAAWFLLAEHRAHVVEYLPYVLLLACPLMHLFHGHGRHAPHGDAPASKGSATVSGESGNDSPAKPRRGCH